MEQEPRPRRPEEDDERPLLGEDLTPRDIDPGQVRRIIRDGIEAAQASGQDIEDWVARHIALQLRDEDGSGLDVFEQSGEVTVDLLAELRRAYVQHLQTPRLGRWLEALNDYAEHRQNRGPVDDWAQQARLRDRFYLDWRATERGYLAARELDREIRLAQDARQMVSDDLAMQLLVQLAPGPHSAIARFAASGQITEELGRELQERYVAGTAQECRWINELGSWMAAKGLASPVPWWRSPAPVEQSVTEQPDPERESEHRVVRLAKLDERLASLPDLGVVPRPPQGHQYGNGYEWMNEGLPEGWHAEPIWGRDGWDLGAWPLIVVALYIDDEHGQYAVAEYVEGDVDTKRYKSRGALYVAVNQIAEFHWRLGQSRGPRDLPEGNGLLAHHAGPYPGWRRDR